MSLCCVIMLYKSKDENNVQHRVWRIDSNIWIFSYILIANIWQIFVWTFVPINFCHTNIFGNLFLSYLFVRIYSDIHSWVYYSVKTIQISEYWYNFPYEYVFGHSVMSYFYYEYIQTFVCIIFLIWIYWDISSINFFMNITLCFLSCSICTVNGDARQRDEDWSLHKSYSLNLNWFAAR